MIAFVCIMWNMILKMKLTPRVYDNYTRHFDLRRFSESVLLEGFLSSVVMSMGALPACVCIHHMYVMSTETKRGC